MLHSVSNVNEYLYIEKPRPSISQEPDSNMQEQTQNGNSTFPENVTADSSSEGALFRKIVHSKDFKSLEKRNARERGRVRAVNTAFTRLRLVVPSITNRNKRVSKLKTLQKAMQYIFELECLLYLPINSGYQNYYYST